MNRIFLHGHADQVFVKVGDRVEKYKTKICTIGTGGGRFYAHDHFSVSRGLSPNQLIKYVFGWSKAQVQKYYLNPHTLGLDWVKMYGPNMNIGVAGYNYLQPFIEGNGYHTGVDVNANTGGNSDLGNPVISGCSGKVIFSGLAGAWGWLIMIEEDEDSLESEGKVSDYPYQGIDVSHWQGVKRGVSINWDEVPDQDFYVIKATEHTSHVDGNFHEWQKELRKRKKKLGYYHFASMTDPIKECDHFINTVGPLQEGEFMVLDFEVSTNYAVQFCKAFLERLEEKTESLPVLYLGNREVERHGDAWEPLTKYPLWVARYPGANDGGFYTNKMPSTGPWEKFAIWQYTSGGSLKGIQGKVDLNVANFLPEGKKVVTPVPVLVLGGTGARKGQTTAQIDSAFKAKNQDFETIESLALQIVNKSKEGRSR